MNSDNILVTLGALVVGAGISWIVSRMGDRAKSSDEELAQVIKDMEQLKVTAVSEARVREIIKDAIEPTSSDVKEIKGTMHEFGKLLVDIQLKLCTELAYKRGKQDKEDK